MVLADGSLLFDTKIDTKGITSGLSAIGSVANSATQLAAKGIATVATGLTAGAAAAVKVGSSFESSMSLVAATMGMTADEIANGSEEFEKLKSAAKEAGATTQFSATQSAEALNYMALAGYTVDEAVQTLPTVLNLAAAGGMDLATASDMVTDSMSALGDSAGTTESFVDKMAKTSQKSNTSVQQLGEAILTVGGTAKTLSGGVDEMNTVLGIFADNGIKGAEGGTALRNVILSLSAPTDTARHKMEELGLEVFDAEGNMRPLNDVFNDLNDTLGTMSQGEQTQVLNEIFNKVDLKSVNALLANCGDRFDELSGYIADCDGAAANMAETMNDNLNGKITILKSALEGLGVSVYENIEDSLKGVVSVVNGYIDELSAVVQTDGLEGLVSAMGAILANLISRGAEYAPLMIELAIQLINAFVQGIYDNLPQIVSAARDIAIAIVNGIGDLCPAVQPLTDLLVILINHLDTILSIAVPLTAAFLGLKAGMAIQSVVQSFQQAQIALALFSMETNGASIAQGLLNGQLGIGEAVTALFTGQMTLAELASAGLAKAQGILNAVMAANPIALVVMAIVALIAVFIVLWNKCDWFREFWISLWENVKSFCVNPVSAIVSFFTESIPNALNSVIAWIQANWQSILLFLINPFAGLFSYFYNNNQKFREFVDNAVNTIKEMPGKIWQFLVDVITKISTWQVNLAQKAIQAGSQFIENIIAFVRELPGKMWGFLLSTVTKVVTWRNNLVSKGKEAAKGLFDTVVDGIKELPSKILDIGNNLVEGLWNGISDKVSWITNKITGFGNSVLNSMKKIFDIHSPSKKFAWIGKMCIEGFDQEFDNFNPYDSMNAAMKANKAILSMSYNAGIEKEFGTSGAFDYYRLAETMVDAFGNSGMTVTLDGRTTGRLIGRYL